MTSLRPDADAFASLLCDWCLRVQAGNQVLVSTTTLAEPLVSGLHRALLDREAWPLVRMSPPALAEDFYLHARERHLDRFAPLELAEVAGTDAVQLPAHLKAFDCRNEPHTEGATGKSPM